MAHRVRWLHVPFVQRVADQDAIQLDTWVVTCRMLHANMRYAYSHLYAWPWRDACGCMLGCPQICICGTARALPCL